MDPSFVPMDASQKETEPAAYSFPLVIVLSSVTIILFVGTLVLFGSGSSSHASDPFNSFNLFGNPKPTGQVAGTSTVETNVPSPSPSETPLPLSPTSNPTPVPTSGDTTTPTETPTQTPEPTPTDTPIPTPTDIPPTDTPEPTFTPTPTATPTATIIPTQ